MERKTIECSVCVAATRTSVNAGPDSGRSACPHVRLIRGGTEIKARGTSSNSKLGVS